jgi:hypothetical protein
MLDKALTTKILDAVRQRPRAMQEIAQTIDRNWRTAERYVEQISSETGMIGTRTFREGTRGALRIVYWNALDAARGSAYQERLLQRILLGRQKEDFSPLDIYQFVAPEKRRAIISHEEFSKKSEARYDTIVSKAQRQILFFSGNLSFIEIDKDMMKTMESLAKRRVNIRVLTRLDTTSSENASKLLAINHRVGWDAIDIRHCEQPLRATIIDDDLCSLKEVLSPGKTREVKRQTFIFYLLEDAEWTAWLQKVFWQLWNQSVDAKTRMDALRTLSR